MPVVARSQAVNVVATFEGMAEARAAMDALEGAGVEPNRASLIGGQAQEAAAAGDTSRRDRRMAGAVGRKLTRGALMGLVVGAVVGVVLGGLMFGLGSGGMWAFLAGGAVLGSAWGAFARAITKLDVNPEWELTYEDVQAGRVGLAVRADDDAQAAKVAELLGDQRPAKVERYDAQGKPQRAP